MDAVSEGLPWPHVEPPVHDDEIVDEPDLADVRGQASARWGLEIAAAGGHHLLLIGTARRWKDDAGASASGVVT